MRVSGKAHLYGLGQYCKSEMTLSQAIDSLKSELEAEAADNDILAAHLEILDDPLLSDSVQDALSRGLSEAEAVDDACAAICGMFESIDDPLLRSRADDVRDVCGRIRMKMLGHVRETVFPDGCILVADGLVPSDMKAICSGHVRGIVCKSGSTSSHVAIIAHSKGIPIQFGVDTDAISEGDYVSVEDKAVCTEVNGENGIAVKVRAAGRKLYANAGSLEDIATAMKAGADGIGLLRTEFLYTESATAPSFDIQRELYSEAMKLCKGKTLTVRTMDIGGDKNVPWLHMEKESNPFLGLRGIRLSLAHPELLKTQLEAIVSAAADVPQCKVRIMFPMVCNKEEVAQAKALIDGYKDLEHIEFGSMIETPAAALDIASLCSECSFFSIGSNDLTQYVMAAERGNPAVAGLYNSLCEPVRFLIRKVVEDSHAKGVETGICGEVASDPSATDFLLDCGLDSLSLNKI